MVLNRRPIVKVLSAVMVVVGVAMLLPMAVSLYYGEMAEAGAFLKTCMPMIIIGLLAIRIIPKGSTSALRMRDGFFIVGVSWLVMSFLGALPFVVSGAIPNMVDAYFETASGFTTTGATIITDVEVLPKGILFWRSFTHWMGGMGVLVLTIALLPMLGIGGQKIMRAETTGPTMEKISFTINDTAKSLYKMYALMTFVQIGVMLLGGVSLYDAALHTFGSVGTGGFSNYGASVAAFGSFYEEMVVAFFMMAAGVNFGLYHSLFSGKPSQMFKDYEFRCYIAIIGASTAFITFMLIIKDYYGNIVESFRYAFFQVVSVMTTTGYATVNYDLWPIPCKVILIVLMFIGGCAGSTGGGIKVIRAAFFMKLIKRGAYRQIHVHAVAPVKVSGRTIAPDTLSGVASFVLLYVACTAIGTLLISLENVSLMTSFSSVLACISNIGPGFELVGAIGNFAFYSAPSKILLSVLMIAGRLELFTIVLLFTPVFWNRNK